MNQGLIPRRYAKALYKLALEKGLDRRVYALMTTLCNSFAENPTMQKTVSNPFVAFDDKTRLLVTAAGADKDDVLYDDFLRLLQRNNRIDLVWPIAIAYRDIYREAKGIKVVSVTSAAPLDLADEQRLKKMIEARLDGGSMEYSSAVDPDLIGGFVIRINNERLDASVANELEQLRLKLLSK